MVPEGRRALNGIVTSRIKGSRKATNSGRTGGRRGRKFILREIGRDFARWREGLNEIQAFRAYWLEGVGDGLRHVGHGRLERFGRQGVSELFAARRRPRLQLLRHGLGLRRGSQRGTARPTRAC